jgi:hypothetical protein
MRLTVDDATFQHIKKDAEIRDLTMTEWVTQAFSMFLHHTEPITKEIYLKDGERNSCKISPLQVEFLHSPVAPSVSQDVVKIQQELMDIRLERDRLMALLEEKGSGSRCVTEEEVNLIHLSGEIEKGSIQLDFMETMYERVRVNYEKLSAEGANRDILSHMQVELERQSYEIQNFGEELHMLMAKRDHIRDEVGRKAL